MIRPGTLVLRSLRHFWRAHLGVVLGAAIGSAALIGALAVGDSVRESLKARAMARLGGVEVALSSGDRLFTDHLPFHGLLHPLTPPHARALHLRGTAARQDGSARANDVQIYGVHSNFWSLSPGADRWLRNAGLSGLPEVWATASAAQAHTWQEHMATWTRPAPGHVRLGAPLAQQLDAKPGDTLILRFAKPSSLSSDSVLSARDDAAAALRLVVDDILDADGFGEFSLRSGQRPALNAFVNLEELWRVSGVTQRVNLVVARTTPDSNGPSSSPLWQRLSQAPWMPDRFVRILRRTFGPGAPSEAGSRRTLEAYQNTLARAWRLEDGELDVRLVEAGSVPRVEILTRRVFLSPEIVSAATRPDPALPEADRAIRSWMNDGTPLVTYLANSLRSGDRLTPYSMVTAAGPPWTPADLATNHVVVTDWLARDLQVGPGDRIEMVHFDPEAGARLVEVTNVFTVHSIVPLDGLYADRTLMPEFPSLAKAESTSEWDAGFPLVHPIRDQDETYWEEHRGTPKAYIHPDTGRRLWGNRFGDTTSIRFAVPPDERPESFVHSVAANLRANLRPADVGLAFQPVRQQALRAATSGQDFGQLFLGFSFFLVLAALILMGLLFRFGLEQRLPEIGTLLALGFQPRQVRRLWLTEGLALAALGSLLGVVGGIAYARAMIHGLTTLWSDAVAGNALSFHLTGPTVIVGLLAAIAVAALTLALTLRRQFTRPARELLAGEIASPHGSVRRRAPAVPIAIVAAVLAIALVGGAVASGNTANPGVFFGAGSLLLVSGLALTAGLLARQPASSSFGVPGLALRGTTRRRSRSLATAGLLACGAFLIASIGAFRLDAQLDAWQRDAGTGGFALLGESALPVHHDLNAAAGLEFFGLSPEDLPDVSFVPFRVREGDDASCLNLDRAQQPRILGVQPGDLARRQAFRFASLAKGLQVTNGWLALRPVPSVTAPPAPDAIPEFPAIGDAASIQWALGRKIGETLDLTDEAGRPFRLRLVGGVANSILQGNLVIDESAFARLFPGVSGYRWFLIDAPTNAVAATSETLSRALRDTGLELTPAPRRLAEFNAVQNTYLTTFQILGGLGLLLGSAGLGVVVLRNVLERRAELALMTAVGFHRRLLARLVLLEHGALLALGLAIGLVSAAVAILPALLSAPGDALPIRSLSLTLAGVVVLGLLTAWAATRAALRGSLLTALHGD
ncbi:MAG: ABC transporter permease [Verrucomicrobiae bacterium]|nr:ABC transporter permease [Verrucomicrobiae bacterium]